jgi:hypothetical protein
MSAKVVCNQVGGGLDCLMSVGLEWNNQEWKNRLVEETTSLQPLGSI